MDSEVVGTAEFRLILHACSKSCVAKTHRDAERCVIASSTHPTSSYVMRLRLGRAGDFIRLMALELTGSITGTAGPLFGLCQTVVRKTLCVAWLSLEART